MSITFLLVVPYSYITLSAAPHQLTGSFQENHLVGLLAKEKAEDFEREEEEITHEQIASVMRDFMDKLVQDVHDDYRVKDFDTMSDLKGDFTSISSEKVTNKFVDFYYEEKGDGLYIVPTSTPPWFEEENEYEVTETSDQTFKVEQNNQSEFYGEYTIVFEIQLNDGNQPFIIDVHYI